MKTISNSIILQIIIYCTIVVMFGCLISLVSRVDKLSDKIDEILDYTYHIYDETEGDYQIVIARDTIFIMDKDREVGKFKLEYNKDPLGTMIIEDNR